MKRALLGMGVVIIMLVSFPVTTAQESEREDVLAGLRKEHPRLLFTKQRQREIERMAKQHDLLARVIRQNHLNAESMLDGRPVRYEIPDGKRLLGQSRYCIERVMALSMAYRLSGDKRFAECAINEMLTAARFKDWNPRHFLDTAEMTTALAVGYDWLFDVISPEDRRVIRQAIVELGLRPGIDVYRSGGWWSKGDNNWNQVCNGGMLMGALAIAEDEPELARQVIEFALASIPRGVSVYRPSGAYPEGPGYWQYGTSYTCVTISALNTALGTDFQISKTPGLDKTGWFRIHTIGPIGLYFNYADSGSRSRLASSMFLLSHTYDEPVYAWWHRRRIEQELPPLDRLRPDRQDRFFPLEIAWFDAAGQQLKADALPRDAFFDSRQDVVTMRSEWDSDAWYVGFKGGDNRANHGHLDIGSFVLDAMGVRWALDLGSDNYNMPGYFGRQRWEYFRLNNRSHNTLVIGDQIQNPTARCDVVAYRSEPDRVHAVVDMTDAYRGQAQSVKRGMAMIQRRAVLVRDEVAGAKDTVRWAMVTDAEIRLNGNRATLSKDGRQLELEILSPNDGHFQELSTRPPTSRERSNEGTQMLAITVAPPPDKELTIELLISKSGDRLPDDARQSVPLDSWGR